MPAGRPAAQELRPASESGHGALAASPGPPRSPLPQAGRAASSQFPACVLPPQTRLTRGGAASRLRQSGLQPDSLGLNSEPAS